MKQKLKFLKQKLKEAFLTKATPSKVALSAAIGIFWNFIPSLGIGPVATYFTAKFLGGKGAIAVSINLATGFFIPLFYTLNMITGRVITGNHISLKEIERQMDKSLEQTAMHIDQVVNEPSQFFLVDKLQSFTVDFFVGALINAFLFSFIFYILIFLFMKFGNPRKYKSNKSRGKSN